MKYFVRSFVTFHAISITDDKRSVRFLLNIEQFEKIGVQLQGQDMDFHNGKLNCIKR